MEPYWPKNDVLLAGRQALADRTPSKKLLGYLEKYQQDLLTTGTPEGLPDFAAQRGRLVELMRQKYAEGQGYHQTVGGRVMNLPKFWELVLSMDFVSHEIELANNIGYDEREAFSGLRSTVEAPYAEFVITSEALKREVASPDEIATPTAPPDIVPAPESASATISLSIEKRIISARADNKEYRISGQLRTGMSPLLFINHLMSHPRTTISRYDIKDITGSSDITEQIRRCGFDKELKEVFFPDTTEQVVYFNPAPALTQERIKLLKNHKWDKVRKGGKT